MNKSLINQYKINFQNQVENFEGYSKVIDKIPYLANKYLSIFLYDWNAQEINEILLPEIETALSNLNSEIENGSETISITLHYDIVAFYDDNGVVYQIPTLDFKEIVIGWRDFLLSAPLNGTKVQ